MDQSQPDYRSDRPAAGLPPGAIGVIVVDDHPLMRAAVCRLIEAEPGLRLLGDASDPAGGLALALATTPHVAMVDLVFPAATGFDLIRTLRARLPRCRAVVLTSVEEPTYAERCLQAGAAGYVGKSEPAGRVVAAIRAVAGGQVFLSEDRACELLSSLRDGLRPLDGPRPERLSPGEFQVFHLIGRGMSNADIARVLCRSVRTVETYRSRIKRKVGAANATQLAQLAAARAGNRLAE